jgi:hypothetical protein
MCDHRRTVVGDNHQLQAVGKGEISDFGASLFGAKRRRGERANERDER